MAAYTSSQVLNNQAIMANLIAQAFKVKWTAPLGNLPLKDFYRITKRDAIGDLDKRMDMFIALSLAIGYTEDQLAAYLIPLCADVDQFKKLAYATARGNISVNKIGAFFFNSGTYFNSKVTAGYRIYYPLGFKKDPNIKVLLDGAEGFIRNALTDPNYLASVRNDVMSKIPSRKFVIFTAQHVFDAGLQAVSSQLTTVGNILEPMKFYYVTDIANKGINVAQEASEITSAVIQNADNTVDKVTSYFQSGYDWLANALSL